MKDFIRKSVFSAVVFMVLASSTEAFCAEKVADTPEFFIKNKIAQIGDVYGGKSVSYTFIVENHGKGELYINRVKGG